MLGFLSDLKINILEAEYTKVSSEWDSIRPHPDVFSRLYFVDSGGGTLVYQGKRIKLTPKNEYLIPSGVKFCPESSPGLGHYWIHFTADITGGIDLFELFDPPVTLPLEPAPKSGLIASSLSSSSRENLYSSVLDISQNGGIFKDFELSTLIRFLILPFLQKAETQDTGDYNHLKQFQAVLDFIDKNLDKDITIPMIAEKMYLNPNYFSGLFKSTLGISPGSFIKKKRIQRAQLLLWNTSLPVKAVSSKVGFDDICYFYRVFKKVTGMTPGNYRKRMSLLHK